MPAMNPYKTPTADPLSRIPMLGGGGSGMAPGGGAAPVINMAPTGAGSFAPSTNTVSNYAPVQTMPSSTMPTPPPAGAYGGQPTVAPSTGGRRAQDIGTHDPGDVSGLSPQDYYQGPTWQELIGMGKNPGGKGFLKKIRKRAPGWLQDPQAFETMMGSINEILGSKGAVDPAVLQRGQADVEAGRAAGEQSIAGRAAMMGITPDDPRYAAMSAINNQTANRTGSERLRDYEILQEQRKRTDLATMNPIMSFLLQMLHPKSAGNIAPGASAASAGPDYGAAAGGVGNALAAFLNNRGS